MTDRWQHQRADRTAGQVQTAAQQFGWGVNSVESASAPATSHADETHSVIDSEIFAGYSESSPLFDFDTDELPNLSSIPVSEPVTPRENAPAPPTRRTPFNRRKLASSKARGSTSTPISEEWPDEVQHSDGTLYRRLPHAVIVMVACAMVLGGGFWSPEEGGQSAAMPGGTDEIRQVTQSRIPDPMTQQLPAPGTQGLVASASDDLMGGYLSTSSLSVTPQQLGVETYIVEQAQTISSVATDTGRSEETLLWANDYSDPSEPLPSGTQLRIPPADGMLHVVSDGDTLENLADRYEVAADAITSYAPNGIERSTDLVPNRLIMVPGGTLPTRTEVIYYTVGEEDQLWQIADRFGLRAQTILWTNNLESSDRIHPGLQLTILPTDGVMVDVEAEDTVESLAEDYGVTSSAIREWPENEVGPGGSLETGQSIMIPGGMPPAPTERESEPGTAEFVSLNDDDEPEGIGIDRSEESSDDDDDAPANGTGDFTWPTTGVITQYFHASHNGWDIANRPGTEILAADHGEVVFSGWDDHGLGYAVGIDHGNGYETWYGHMKEHPPVEVGDTVEQGDFIGPMGNTGFSTGPHVHFVIAYNGQYQDPGSYLQ